jgi:ATP-binding cassette subfamily F protein 3
MLAGLQNVTFEFGARILVEDATWHIQPNERIGLIGYNGTGKSTILKLLAGEYQPSKGTIERSRETSVGYLHQDLLSFNTRDSILKVALGAFEKVLQLEKEIEDLGKQLEMDQDASLPDRQEKLLHEYADKLHKLETLGGYSIHHKTEEVLQGLGFPNSDLQRPYNEFSGGWRMRVLLAKMILQQPDLLLLDEPTNHLDLPSIEWLEKYLQHYQGSVVIVSHDKYFLNRMVTKIVELYQKELHIYNGNFDFYEKEKAERIALQQRAYENQQEFIRQQERFIDRFRAKASKAAQAQSALKRLEKLERIEDVEVERPNIKINFRVDKTPGKVLVELKDVSKSFGENIIVEHTSVEIDRGDKIALIGANGKGKSTLLRIIAGTETFGGERKWGHNVDEAFYAQHQLEALNVNNTVLDEMNECGSQKTELELRTLLGCFLFSGDEVEKKIRVLSGGEKARVALAKTIISKANFLLLDEPTNHLDMHSSDLLVEALNRYEGSYILVSHDRFFISKTANKIWEIVDHKIKEFKGGYDEYVEWSQRTPLEKERVDRPLARKDSPKESLRTFGTADGKQPGTGSQELKNKTQETGNDQKGSMKSAARSAQTLVKKELQKQQRIFQQLEEKIADLNKKKKHLETALADPATYSDKNKFLQTETEYKKVFDELAIQNSEYEKVFEKIMELENQ